MRVGGARKGAQGWSYPRRFVFKISLTKYITDFSALYETAVSGSNMVFEIDTGRDALDPDLAKLPPSIIESKITVDNVEYPIVRSYPVPNGTEWNDSWANINRQIVTLINLGHGACLNFNINSRPAQSWMNYCSAKDQRRTNMGKVSYR